MASLSLGVHIIARDEEELLPRCLESIAELYDELIVVDTGSTDRTKQIAETYGAKIITVKWNDDFSEPRNVALERAQTDWIFYLDADEWLLSSAHSLRHCLTDSEAAGFWTRIENEFGPQRENRVIHESLRLFRRDPSYRFTGKIHEDITPAILAKHSSNAIKSSLISIGHSGYLPERIQQKNKINRNQTILLNVLTEKPNDPFSLYNLGVSYCQSRQLEQALEQFQKAFHLIPPLANYRPTFLRDYAKLLFALERYDACQTLLDEGRKAFPDYHDLHVMLGEVLEQQGLLEAAYLSYQAATQIEGNKRSYVTEAGMSTYVPLWKLARICQKRKMYDRAESYCLKALSYFPQHKELLNDWVRLLALQHLSNEQVAERLRAFEQIIRLDRAPTLLHLSKCLYREGYVLQAADYFLQLLSSDYLDAEGLYFLSEIVYRRKGYIQAADLFERVLELEPRHVRASLGAALCYMRLGKQTLLEGLEKNPNHPGLIHDLRQLEQSVNELEQMNGFTASSKAERRNNPYV